MVYQEKEITLVVYKENADLISNQIAALDQITEYTLKEPDIHHIIDVSFDTNDRNLFRNHMSLRIRSINRRCLFTLKSSPVFDMSGIVKRDELELDWHPDSFGSLTDALIKSGIELPRNYKFDSDWYKSMSSLGMNVLQERHTERRTKDVFCEQTLVAELAIDKVKYKYEKGDILHREIEIESKSTIGDSTILSISEYLVGKYPHALLIWMPSKLELGLVLSDLIQSGDQELINNHKISPELYCDLNEIWKRKSQSIN